MEQETHLIGRSTQVDPSPFQDLNETLELAYEGDVVDVHGILLGRHQSVCFPERDIQKEHGM